MELHELKKEMAILSNKISEFCQKAAIDEAYEREHLREATKNGSDLEGLLEDWFHEVCNLGHLDSELVDAISKDLSELAKEDSWGLTYVDPEKTLCVTTELTGHQYYGSPYETCDGCGNCNGARCDVCRIHWSLEDHRLPIDHKAIEGSEVTDWYTDTFRDNKKVAEGICKYMTGRQTKQVQNLLDNPEK